VDIQLLELLRHVLQERNPVFMNFMIGKTTNCLRQTLNPTPVSLSHARQNGTHALLIQTESGYNTTESFKLELPCISHPNIQQSSMPPKRQNFGINRFTPSEIFRHCRAVPCSIESTMKRHLEIMQHSSSHLPFCKLIQTALQEAILASMSLLTSAALVHPLVDSIETLESMDWIPP
jgi:hypothetical protein